MNAYPDLHDHIRALEEKGLLMRVTRPINKDTEMHPLVRWQFRGGIPESQRRAFLFENVTDSKGRRFDIPVAVGILASNRAIYSTGIGCDVEHIREKWDHAEAQPVEPVLGENPPCQEVVMSGDALRRPGNGVDALPIPISTPGFDNAPYASCSMFVSKDPETGQQKPFLKHQVAFHARLKSCRGSCRDVTVMTHGRQSSQIPYHRTCSRGIAAPRNSAGIIG